MIDQPPGGPPEEQLPPDAQPSDVPPPAPPPEAPPAPPPPPQQPMPSPVELQAAQAQQHFNAARQTLGQQYQALDAAERSGMQQAQIVISQIQSGAISQEQAAPMLEALNRERQQRLSQADQIQKAAAELQTLERETALHLQDQHRRGVLEPVAKKMGIDMLADEAAERSGDPEGFNKARLKRQLDKVPPDAWRALQEAAIEDHRDQRLTQRAAQGTDEMGGTGTGGGVRENASADENIMAGLRQHYPHAR